MKFTDVGITLILMTLLFFYEYMFRGLKVLIKDKELTLFPDNLYGFIIWLLTKRKISYRIKRQKMLAYIGVFLSGLSFALLSVYFLGVD